MKWRTEQSIASFSEDVIIAYLDALSKTVKPSTLWSHYSMLKTILLAEHDIDIKQYANVIEYLKSKNKRFRAKKSNTLCNSHIDEFLTEAPDEKYLMTKVKKKRNQRRFLLTYLLTLKHYCK